MSPNPSATSSSLLRLSTRNRHRRIERRPLGNRLTDLSACELERPARGSRAGARRDSMPATLPDSTPRSPQTSDVPMEGGRCECFFQISNLLFRSVSSLPMSGSYCSNRVLLHSLEMAGFVLAVLVSLATAE